VTRDFLVNKVPDPDEEIVVPSIYKLEPQPSLKTMEGDSLGPRQMRQR
jgi:hypothetical protein